MKPRIDYSLYLITDRELMSTSTVERSVELAVAGGCTLVQLREKNIGSLEFYTVGRRVREITRQSGVPLIINDRADIALALEADGLHIGQDDLPAAVARRIIGPDRILGVSASNCREAKEAEADGADYLGVGAMFATATKTDADVTSFEELKAIRAATSLPIVAIGGINACTAPLFAGLGIDGLAVVSAIVASDDIETAARHMKELASCL